MREELFSILKAALEGANPYLAVKKKVQKQGESLVIDENRYQLKDYDKITLVGAGKAAVSMALAIEEILGERIDKGVVVTKDHYPEPSFPTLDKTTSVSVPPLIHRSGGECKSLKKIRLLEASHPIPDARGERGAKEIIAVLKELTERDLLICLISGGASALIPSPVAGLSLRDKKSLTELLLKCGANINEINTVRKHLSLLKGGGMARLAYPATVVTLILSDVIGDPLDVIGSGPTVSDPTSFQDCLEIVRKYRLEGKIPPSALALFKQPRKVGKEIQETPKPGDPVFSKVTNVIIGNNCQALRAASTASEKWGFKPLILTSCLEGEAREAGKVLGAIVKEIRKTGNPLTPPVCLLAGGETTVTVKGKGKGGRNQELALALAINVAHLEDILIACMGTDGTDGPTEAAGAIVDGKTVSRASNFGLNCWQYLSDNNSYNFFRQLNDLLLTGPTGTNVMDIFVALIK